jgi:RNA polymerase sigma factor (sigma-70 family)
VQEQSKFAFVAAVERLYGAGLRRFLSRKLRNAAADAPDLFQEVFVRLLQAKNPETIRNPQAYLYTIAGHVLHQFTQHRATAVEAAEPASELPSTAADPADEADLQQQLAEIGRALETFSPRAHATLVMYRCEGLTLAEIGKRLGVSTQMARKYLMRAIVFCDQYSEKRGAE